MTEMEQARDALRCWARQIGQVAGLEAAYHTRADAPVTVFSVRTAGGQCFILKDVAGMLDADRIETEYDLLRHLQTHGVPVAVPILSDSGQLCARGQERAYVLYPSLPVDNDVPRAEVARVYANVGAAVARLHRALALYRGQIDSWTMDLPHQVFEGAVPAISRALDEEDAVRFRRTAAALEAEMVPALTDLPAQTIHGDCHGGNYLLYRGDVSGFVDLDHLPTGPRVYDVGYLLADMAKAQFFGIDAHRDWLATFHHVIAGYEREHPLSAREKNALWFVMLATQLLFVEWFLAHHQDDLAATNLEAFYWIYQHRGAIAGRISCAQHTEE